jgi:hypothetical protein
MGPAAPFAVGQVIYVYADAAWTTVRAIGLFVFRVRVLVIDNVVEELKPRVGGE